MTYTIRADSLVWVVLMLGGFGSGLIDSIVGGGALIQLPLLFSALPGELPACNNIWHKQIVKRIGNQLRGLALCKTRKNALAYYFARCACRVFQFLSGGNGGFLLTQRNVAAAYSLVTDCISNLHTLGFRGFTKYKTT